MLLNQALNRPTNEDQFQYMSSLAMETSRTCCEKCYFRGKLCGTVIWDSYDLC